MNHKSTLEQRGGGSAVDTAIHDSLPPRPATFVPDYGIEHTSSEVVLTPWGWCVCAVCVVAFVVATVYNFGNN